MTQGTVFNIQRFSLQDGPGLRTTVFLKGCPLACLWCHNPESRAPEVQLLRMENRCMACGRCEDEEPAAGPCRTRTALDMEDCPTGALQQVGRTLDAPTLVRELLQDRIFFDESGGGVTLSGGEPLLQASFLLAVLDLLAAQGVHTALDTSGFAPWDELRAAATRSSLVLYDLKLMDETRHRAATGQSNRLILDNLEALAAVHSRIWIRIPVVPGLNDDETDLECMARFLEALPGVRRVELLPYHRTGVAKFARLGLDYPLAGLAPPTGQRLEALAAIFRARGLTAAIGGTP